MQAWGQPALFAVREDEQALDAQLDRLGYQVHDPAVFYLAPVTILAAQPPLVTTFEIWEPLAIMREIWEETGTGRDRQAVMDRATCAKTAIFGRVDAQPAGVAYVGATGDIAMVHALATLPQHRRKGLARHIMAQAALWAARQGCAHLALAVGRDNAPARALYASLGMEAVGHYHYRTKE